MSVGELFVHSVDYDGVQIVVEAMSYNVYQPPPPEWCQHLNDTVGQPVTWHTWDISWDLPSLRTGAFDFDKAVTVPGSPRYIYKITGTPYSPQAVNIKKRPQLGLL